MILVGVDGSPASRAALRTGDAVEAAGDAGHVLTGAARRATLLVLGGNHLVGVAPGGVVTHCLRHAPCPVVVVPATR
ncbi:hypothetical protein ACFV4N_29715 [Actinosynnema sp. NPDC059797]